MQNVVSEDSINRAFGGAGVGSGDAASVFAGAVSNCASSGWSPEDFIRVVEAYARCFDLGSGRGFERVDFRDGGDQDGDGGRGSSGIQVPGRHVVGAVCGSRLDLSAGVDRSDGGGVGRSDVSVCAPCVCSEVRVGVEEIPEAVTCDTASGSVTEPVGKHHVRNRLKREKQKAFKQQWRGEAAMSGGGSESSTVRTVDTRTGVEIEAAQTLAARRVAENKVKIAEAKVAAKLAEHRLKALNDKDRSVVIDRLAAARLEEKINTAKSKSQKSFNECGSPLESVGSAMSASEFAFKQMVRKVDAEKQRNDYLKVQLSRYHAYSPDYVNQMVAEIPEPRILTEREMEEEDEDLSPFMSQEEMEADAARFQHG